MYTLALCSGIIALVLSVLMTIHYYRLARVMGRTIYACTVILGDEFVDLINEGFDIDEEE